MAQDWGCKPWELTGEAWEQVTPWQMHVWQVRYSLYVPYTKQKHIIELEQMRINGG